MTAASTPAPVTALGVECARAGGDIWRHDGPALRVRVFRCVDGSWGVSAYTRHATDYGRILADGAGATLAEADAACEREWAAVVAAVAARGTR